VASEPVVVDGASSSDGGGASMTVASLEKALCESLAHRYSGLKGVLLGRRKTYTTLK